jgi:hypothetical protein
MRPSQAQWQAEMDSMMTQILLSGAKAHKPHYPLHNSEVRDGLQILIIVNRYSSLTMSHGTTSIYPAFDIFES